MPYARGFSLFGVTMSEFWKPTEQRADSVRIDGQATPGTVTFSGLGLKHKWEVLDKTPYTIGGLQRWTGRELSEFDMNIRLWTPADWSTWHEKFLPKLRAADPRTGHSLEHPLLTSLGLGSVTFVEIGAAEPSGTAWEVKIGCREYHPPQKGGGKVSGATAAGNPAKDPNADLKSRIAALTKAINARRAVSP